MDPTDGDRELLMELVLRSGFVRVERSVDHQPYARLLELHWLSIQHSNDHETIYRVTRAGIAALGLD